MCIGVLPHVCLCEDGRSWSYRLELPWGCWDLSLAPLEEQSVSLTAEPSFQPRFSLLYKDSAASVAQKHFP